MYIFAHTHTQVGVIIVSVIMGVAALELLRASIGTLVMALGYGKIPNLGMLW